MSLLTRLNDTQYRFLHAIRHPGALDVGRRPGTAKDFSALNGGRHVLIVTFRRSGEPIPTPVNFGLDGEGRLYFRSERRVPKVRRIENDPHVRVCPCNFRGKPTGPVTEGRARVLPKEEETQETGVKKRLRMAVKCDLCSGRADMACIYNCPCGAIERIDPTVLLS